jgi:hypothetical protein
MFFSKRSGIAVMVLCFLLQTALSGVVTAQEREPDTSQVPSATAPGAVKAKLGGKTLKGEAMTVEPGRCRYSYNFSYDNCLSDAFIPEKVETGQYINHEWVGRVSQEGDTYVYFYFNTKYPIIDGELALSTMYAQPNRYADIYVADEHNNWRQVYDGLTGDKNGRLIGITVPADVLSPYIKNRTEVVLLVVIHKKGPYFSGIAKHSSLPFFSANLDISKLPAVISAISTDKLLYAVDDDIGVSVELEGLQASQSSFKTVVKLLDASGSTIRAAERQIMFGGRKKQVFDFKINTKGLAPGDYAIGADLADNGKVFFTKKLDAFALMGK